jgi:hypothetical protein
MPEGLLSCPGAERHAKHRHIAFHDSDVELRIGWFSSFDPIKIMPVPVS